MNALTNGRPCLWLDQYGNRFHAATRAELVATIGGGRVSKMYRDTRDGRVLWCGYVIGPHWLTCYQPRSVEVN